jgi:hypothetical protein
MNLDCIDVHSADLEMPMGREAPQNADISYRQNQVQSTIAEKHLCSMFSAPML